MGALADCISAGVPRQILVPLLPVNQDFGGKGHGKAPAKFNAATGRWEGIDQWQLGDFDPDVLRACDAAGGNAGVILGAPYGGLQMLAIDIDLEDLPKSVAWCKSIVYALQRLWGQTVLVRESWPYRALLLVNLPVDAIPGAKKKFTISYTDPATPGSEPEVIGKIELLARGQQAAIAGNHISGNPMRWYFLADDQETERYMAPPVKINIGQSNEKITLPTFPTFDAVAASVVELLTAMQQYGFTYSMLALTAATGPAPPIFELAAPSADAIATLLAQTPNPKAVDRDIYANFMHAIAGAQAGLAAVRGALAYEEREKIAKAAAEWASRWNAPANAKAGTYEEELGKWTTDWGVDKDSHLAGWRNLLNHCQAFGAPASALADLAMDKAQDSFKADTSTPIPSSEIPGRNLLTVEQLKLRQGVRADMVVTSDIAVAERLLSFFSGNAVWVPGLGTWLAWDGGAGWKSDEVTACKVGIMISDRLWWYVGLHGRPNPMQNQAGWDAATHDKMLSEGKLNKISNVIRMHLSMPASEINLGVLRLQTPRNMYDLADMQSLDVMRRKLLYETRSTGIEPAMQAGETKYFDKLTLDLCDGNREVQEWLLHYIGYCLLGAPGEAVFVVVWGSGNNGKSTLAKVLQFIFGTYSVSLDADVIQESGKDKHPASLNRLRNKRLAMISELDANGKWNNRRLKMITGGDDIEARDMNRNPTPFKSQAGLIIFSNDKPPIERADPAIQRRFRLIETVIRRTEAQRIKDLEERICRDEAPSVLRKLMQYAQKVYLAGGLPETPAIMKAAANATMAETDLIFGWLQDECEYNTTEVAAEEESIDNLRKRCEAYIARQDQSGGMVADKIQPKLFLDRLRREGISLEDPTRLDTTGKPTRHRRRVKSTGGIETFEYLARGIKLRVRAVA